jgi:restriction endonuclease Mrr
MIPKFNETMLPILKLLWDNNEYRLGDIVENLYEEFGVTDDEKRIKISNGTYKFDNQIWWGKSYLKQAWLIYYPKRWYTKITEEGLKVLSEGLSEITVAYLKKYDNFVKFLTPAKRKLVVVIFRLFQMMNWLPKIWLKKGIKNSIIPLKKISSINYSKQIHIILKK